MITLNNKANYIKCKRNPVDEHELDIREIEPKYHNRKYIRLEADRKIIDFNFDEAPQKLKEYFDVHEGVKSWDKVYVN